jgi:peptidyl-prolyl cis-trans isomerase A (cyclophilin A)
MIRAFVLCALLPLACTSSTAPKSGAAEEASAKPVDEPAVAPELLDPDAATATAPDDYVVEFTTTEGKFVVTVHRAWAPIGADRFYNLVRLGFYDDVAFFRVVEGFMVQFGLHGAPKVNTKWKVARIADDKRTQPNRKGTISFANSGPNTRTTQVFINFNDNVPLDSMGFAPFGEVTAGMDVVMKLHNGYGDGPPSGPGPDQREIERNGNSYLRRRYPELDWIEKATIVSKP